MVKAGAFDSIFINRKALYDNIPNIIQNSKTIHENKINNQSSLFLEDNHKQLVSMGIQPKKMMPGLLHRINTANGELDSRTLMLADLTIRDSIRLQQSGLGTGRKLGCGIFIPHKGIDPVGGAADK